MCAASQEAFFSARTQGGNKERKQTKWKEKKGKREEEWSMERGKKVGRKRKRKLNGVIWKGRNGGKK